MVNHQQRMKSINVIQQQESCGDTRTPLLSLKEYCIIEITSKQGITTSTTDCPPTKLETARTRGAP